MISFLFSLLLVPLLPELANPADQHSDDLNLLAQRIRQSQEILPQTPMDLTQAQVESARDLPLITGRLFDWSATQRNAKGEVPAANDLPVETLRLTGMIESAGQRVAILNDGQKDHVVAVGSYVLNTYKVISFGVNRVVLMPLDGLAGGKPLELNLMPGTLPGGL
ncbi:Tfp pilus assembly protein PilP [Limnobacter thiooxidans]|uniref:Uncharacterized protein n=1 Tax=Limnobacter thiooxidans TaxID=131080 RepID=A0AA86J0F1_9BURK|nr:hypothetical protein [Limnobacter sp.]MCZ8015063.1 hypothetical protein [Limnobacter sp.]RZS40280.1 Tfp pilus assembly protein PilP [Limnobacter thiooxidans]BET27287.1 hypothetical protein RGQ30_27880 [Limnobacter thiooxidans]